MHDILNRRRQRQDDPGRIEEVPQIEPDIEPEDRREREIDFDVNNPRRQ